MTLSHSGASELNQLMESTTAGAPSPEIVHRGSQELLDGKVTALTGSNTSSTTINSGPGSVANSCCTSRPG